MRNLLIVVLFGLLAFGTLYHMDTVAALQAEKRISAQKEAYEARMQERVLTIFDIMIKKMEEK